jgi:hypothetical protein
MLTDAGMKQVPNPLEQARQYAHAVVDVLEKDPQLTFSSGRMKGRPLFPWTYGVVLANISRRQFEAGRAGGGAGTPPGDLPGRDDRIRRAGGLPATAVGDVPHRRLRPSCPCPRSTASAGTCFPRSACRRQQIGLFDEVEQAEAPDLLRVMDLQQEQLARSLGEGHRVIHGVAGSGKTLILGYRAEHLARVCAKPILVLCYNKALARRLEHWMHAQGRLGQGAHRAASTAWCHASLTVYHVGLPQGDPGRPMVTMAGHGATGDRRRGRGT